MKSGSRKVLAGAGIVAGVALVSLELMQFSGSGPVERWFWLAVGVLVTIFGSIEFLSGAGRP